MKGYDAEQVAHLLIDVAKELNKRVRDCLQMQGVPMITLVLLRELGERPGTTVSQLARHLQLSKGYVSIQLERLEGDGLVCKQADPRDQRLIRVGLSPAGQELRSHLRGAYRSSLQEALRAIPGDEAALIIATLQKLRKVLPTHDQQPDLVEGVGNLG